MIPQSAVEGTRYGLNIRDAIDPTERDWSFLLGKNLGNETLLLCLPFEDFLGNSFIPNEAELSLRPELGEVAQRPLNMAHATSLGRFILKGILKQLRNQYVQDGAEVPQALEELIKIAGPQPYMALQPIVANLRNFKIPDLRFNNEGSKVYLGKRHVLHIIDGQHRHKGMQMVRQFVNEILENRFYPKKPDLLPELSSSEHEDDFEDEPLLPEKRSVTPEELEIWGKVQAIFHSDCRVMVEAHLGLNKGEERQLFHDLNNLARKVEKSMAQEFDQSNPINLYIKNYLGLGKGVLEVEIIPSDKKTDREYDGTFSLKEMTAINAILFLNRFNTKSAVPTKVEKYAGKANEFWKMVNSIPGITNPGIKTVATQSVILKALANLYYLFSEGKISAKSGLDIRRAKAEQKKNLEALVDGVTRGKISFSHENPIWRYYERDTNPQDPKFKNEQGRWLSEYLPGEDKEIPVIGAYDPNSRTMKFATQHNSIFPILGDMIRWQLCLPIKTRRNTEKKKRRR
jgi:DNA-sulfur modification-associated